MLFNYHHKVTRRSMTYLHLSCTDSLNHSYMPSVTIVKSLKFTVLIEKGSFLASFFSCLTMDSMSFGDYLLCSPQPNSFYPINIFMYDFKL